MSSYSDELCCMQSLMAMHLGISFGFKDDSLCIEKKNDVWNIYCVERGNIFDHKSYDDVYRACKDILVRLSDSDEKQEELFTRFSTLLLCFGVKIDLNDLGKEKK